MENKKPNNKHQKNLLEVDLGFYGKVNSPNGPSASEFFKSLEAKQTNKDLIQTLREKYNDVLENEIYPEIETKIKNYIQKISGVRCAGDLKKLMNDIAGEGLIIAESQDDGKRVYYRKQPKLERTQAIISEYSKKKSELSKKYNEIISKPNGIRIDGRKSPAKGDKRTGSYSLVLTVDFGENKHEQETVRITDFLPVHGPTPEFQDRTYIIGYSVPAWLKHKIPEIKQKIQEAKNKIKEIEVKLNTKSNDEPENKNTAVINIKTALLQEAKIKNEKEKDLVKAAA